MYWSNANSASPSAKCSRLPKGRARGKGADAQTEHKHTSHNGLRVARNYRRHDYVLCGLWYKSEQSPLIIIFARRRNKNMPPERREARTSDDKTPVKLICDALVINRIKTCHCVCVCVGSPRARRTSQSATFSQLFPSESRVRNYTWQECAPRHHHLGRSARTRPAN